MVGARLLLVLLLLLGGWLFWLPLWLQEPTSQAPQVVLPGAHGEPDAVIDGGHLQRYDAQGRHYQSIQSLRVTHYPDQKLATFDQPAITHWTPEGQSWLLSAEQAIWHEKAPLLLKNQVHLQPLHSDAPASLTTDHLFLDTETQTAFTEARVILKLPGSETQGKGLMAHLDSGNLTLLSAVEGVYWREAPQEAP